MLCSLTMTSFLQYGGPLDPIYIPYPGYTISNPGYYALSDVLTGSSPLITVATHDIVLDLNGYTLKQTNSTSSCIAINPGAYNVTIQNGYISGNGANIGIQSQGHPGQIIDNIIIQNILFSQCSKAIDFNFVNNSHIIQSIFSLNDIAIYLNSSTNVVIDDCNFYQSGMAACLLNNSSNNNMRYCKILGTQSSQYSYGFYSSGGSTNTINHCIIESVYSDNSSSLLSAGISFEGEFSSNILNTSIVDITGKNSYGIFAPGYYQEDLQQYLQAYTGVAWSPDGRYIAGYQPGYLICCNVNDRNKITSTFQFYVGSQLTSAAWAPQPSSSQTQYVAIGGQDSHGDRLVQVYSFDGKGLTLVASLDDDPTFDCTAETYTNLVWGLSWSSDGNYLAVAQSDSGKKHGFITVLQFTPSSNVLNPICTNSDSVANCFNAVAWQPHTNFIAAAGYVGDKTEVRAIYLFDSTKKTIKNQVTDKSDDDSSMGTGVSWSPDGHYVAFVGNRFSTSRDLYVYLYDTADPGVLQVVAKDTDGGDHDIAMNAVAWSSQLPYFAVGAQTHGTGPTFIYQFNLAERKLTRLVEFFDPISSEATTFAVQSLSWKPGQLYLALGAQDLPEGQEDPSGSHVSITSFNLGCVVLNDLVSAAQGVGIESNNQLVDSLYTTDVVISNRALQNTPNYGPSVEWEQTDWDKVHYLSNFSWEKP